MTKLVKTLTREDSRIDVLDVVLFLGLVIASASPFYFAH